MRKLRKLKFDPSKPGLFVAWEDWDQEAGRFEECTLKCNERPRTALLEALLNMRRYLIEICELPASWEDEIRIRGLTIKEDSNGITGIVISGIRELRGSEAPLVLNSPYVVEESEDDLGVYSDECAGDLVDLAALVWRYLDGDRAGRQIELDELTKGTGLEGQPIELRLSGEEQELQDEIAADLATAVGTSVAGKRSRTIIE